MYSFFRYFHSGFRFMVLLLVVVAILQAFVGWLGKKPYTEAYRKVNLFTMISFHTQLLIGLVLYFISPLVQFSKATMKDAHLRYFTVEHITMMIIAIAIVTVGHARSKRAITAEGKHKAIAIFYTIGVLVVILALIHGGITPLGMTR